MLGKIIIFYRIALTYVEPDESALQRAGINKDRYVKQHRRFVNISRAFGVVGALFGLIGFVAAVVTGPGESKDARAFIVLPLAPVIGFMGGCVVGAAFACMVASKEFLLGPLGKKWMDFVGTKNVLVARFVCLIVVVLFGGGTTGIMAVSILRPDLQANKSGKKADISQKNIISSKTLSTLVG